MGNRQGEEKGKVVVKDFLIAMIFHVNLFPLPPDNEIKTLKAEIATKSKGQDQSGSGKKVLECQKAKLKKKPFTAPAQ